MVVVKVRETYDLKTVQNKMTVIAIHTPKPDIIKRNYPGLLMQCRAYRPLAANVRVACASVLPLDPLGVGTEAGDVAPEDVFNPILYKAMSNKGMSQLEARINALNLAPSIAGADVAGDTATVDVDSFTSAEDDFNIYYGLLSQTHDWKHANPQAGLSMSNLRPLVYEFVYNVGDESEQASGGTQFAFPGNNDTKTVTYPKAILGKAKSMPFMNCTSYTTNGSNAGFSDAGFNQGTASNIWNCSVDVPYLSVVCGCIIIPPSRLHSLYFRMVCEWEIEFTSIRPLSEITNLQGLGVVGYLTHFQNYSYEETKKALTGSDDTILENDTCMVSSNADVKKVM